MAHIIVFNTLANQQGSLSNKFRKSGLRLFKNRKILCDHRQSHNTPKNDFVQKDTKEPMHFVPFLSFFQKKAFQGRPPTVVALLQPPS